MASWLVTGGCGFIGSHLVDALLARGDKVRVLDDLSSGKQGNLAAGAVLVVGSVADQRVVAEAAKGVEGIFHLAAVASVERHDLRSRPSRIRPWDTATGLWAARRVLCASPLPPAPSEPSPRRETEPQAVAP